MNGTFYADVYPMYSLTMKRMVGAGSFASFRPRYLSILSLRDSRDMQIGHFSPILNNGMETNHLWLYFWTPYLPIKYSYKRSYRRRCWGGLRQIKNPKKILQPHDFQRLGMSVNSKILADSSKLDLNWHNSMELKNRKMTLKCRETLLRICWIKLVTSHCP